MNLRNLGKWIVAIPQIVIQNLINTDGENGDEVVVELFTQDEGAVSDGAVVAVQLEAVLSEDETLTGTIDVITDADNSFADPDVVKTTGAITLTGDTGGSIEEFLANLDLDLVACKPSIGLRFTPTLSSVSTSDLNYCRMNATIILGGFPELPPTTVASDAGIHQF